ncbi:hypothetical protein Pelo_13627 [Pelomyxa schiedti]|nr:hypothetical protein Pelo_13627 [Pelomyxa schiedti]
MSDLGTYLVNITEHCSAVGDRIQETYDALNLHQGRSAQPPSLPEEVQVQTVLLSNTLQETAVLFTEAAGKLLSFSRGDTSSSFLIFQPAPQLERATIHVKLGDHLCLPYSKYETLTAAAIKFLLPGIGSACVVLFVGRKVLEIILGALSSHGIDTNHLLEEGLIVAMGRANYRKLLTPDARCEKMGQDLENILERGPKSIYLLADLPKSQGKEHTIAKTPREWQDSIVEYERRATVMVQRLPVTALCCYNTETMSKMSPSFPITEATRAHPFMLQETGSQLEICACAC